MSKVTKRRFQVEENVGSFLYEPWLIDLNTGTHYRYDKVPAGIKKAFAEEMRRRRKVTADEARMLVDFVIEVGNDDEKRFAERLRKREKMGRDEYRKIIAILAK